MAAPSRAWWPFRLLQRPCQLQPAIERHRTVRPIADGAANWLSVGINFSTIRTC